MQPEVLSGIAGVILSLIMSYIPGLNTAYAGLSTGVKQMVMGILIIIAATGSAMWACSTPVAACMSGLDWKAWISSVIAALVANQSAHRISPTPDAVKAASPAA